MAKKSKITNYEGYFNKIKAILEEEFGDTEPFLADLDGDQRILVHAVFFIATKSLIKKVSSDSIFNVLRKFQEGMLRNFIIDPNSEKVDELLEKCDLLIEAGPAVATSAYENDEDSTDMSVNIDLFSWINTAVAFVDACSDDQLDDMLDDLSLKMGAPGSNKIESYLPDLCEEAEINSNHFLSVEDTDSDEYRNEGPTITELRNMSTERQILVLKLLEVNVSGFTEIMDCDEIRYFGDDVRYAIDTYEEGDEGVSVDISDAIDSLNDVIAYINSDEYPTDQSARIGSIMFSGMAKVFIDSIGALSEDELYEMWDSVRNDNAFDDEKVINLSRRLNDEHLPGLFQSFLDSQNPELDEED